MTTSKQYNKLKNNEVKYATEKQRLNDYNKSKYHNNEEYRQRVLLYQRTRREALKEIKKNLNNQPIDDINLFINENPVVV